MATTTKFNFKKQHLYVKAKVDGSWFEVSHFMFENFKKPEAGMVWLKAGYNSRDVYIQSGFVDISKVEEWVVAE